MCQFQNKFYDCVERVLRRQELTENEPSLSQQFFDESQMSEPKQRFLKNKRNPQNPNPNDELFSFFRNAVAKNYKLKSSIKTTRF